LACRKISAYHCSRVKRFPQAAQNFQGEDLRKLTLERLTNRLSQV
jgi:hypothetical protein